MMEVWVIVDWFINFYMFVVYKGGNDSVLGNYCSYVFFVINGGDLLFSISDGGE